MHSPSADNPRPRPAFAGRRFFGAAGFWLLATLFSSCSRDPEYAKRRDLENGNRYAAAGRHREALIMYRSALRRDSRFGEAYYRRALAEDQQGLVGASVGSFRRAVELLPESQERLESRIRLGRLLVFYLDRANLEDAVVEELDQLGKDLIEKKLDEFHGRFFRGQAAIFRARSLENRGLAEDARDSLRQAVPHLEAANRQKPFDPGVTLALSRTYWADGDPGAAERTLRSLLSTRKDQPQAWRELFRLLSTQKGRGEEAEKVLTAAAEANPKEYSLLATLAEFYQFSGRRADAESALNRLKSHAAEYPEAFERAADIYSRLGDRDNVIRQYEDAIRALPDRKLHFQKQLAAAYVAYQRRGKASEIVEQILKEYPKDMDARVRRAELRLDSGDVAGAAAELHKLANEDPHHFALQYNLGRVSSAAGKPEDARVYFAEAARLAPVFSPARLQLAEIEFATGEYLKAVMSAEEVLKHDSASVPARLLRAAGLRKLKRFAESRAQIGEILKVFPQHAQALYQLAEIEFDQGKLEAAEGYFRKSYEANPANPSGLLAVADLHFARGRGAQVLDLLRQEVKRFPDRKDLRLQLGDAALRLNRCDVALPLYEALSRDSASDKPALAQIENRLGACYRNTGKFQESLAHLMKARDLAPTDPGILHNVGIVLDQLGRKQEARSSYEASLKLAGDNPVALNNLAFHMAEQGGDLDQALTYAQRARTRSPLRLEFADTVGWIYLKKNLTKEAVEVFAELVAKQPGNPTFRYHYGVALLKQGQRERARRELRAALTAGAPVDEKNLILKVMEENSL